MTAETSYGPVQLQKYAELWRWQFERARAAGLIPDPDMAKGRWSANAAAAILADRQRILAAVAEQPRYGAWKSAAALAQRTGQPVEADDITELAAAGLIAPVDQYKGTDLYATSDVEALADQHPDRVAEQVQARSWALLLTLSHDEAIERLGWSDEEWRGHTADRALQVRADRYLPAEIGALAADRALRDVIDTAREERARARLYNAVDAADRMEIRRLDFDLCVEAGWIVPARHGEMQLTRHKTITVPYYRGSDIDALRDIPGVDWEAVRTTPSGKPSPLREFVRVRPKPPQIMRSLAAALTEQLGTVIEARYDGDRWRLRWPVDEPGHPTADAVRKLIGILPEAVNLARQLPDGAAGLQLDPYRPRETRLAAEDDQVTPKGTSHA